MEEGKVSCPHCKGKKKEKFDNDGFTIKRLCLTCDEKGTIWWIEEIIKPQGFPYGYVREDVSLEQYPYGWGHHKDVKIDFESDISWKESIANKKKEDEIREYRRTFKITG